MKPDDEICYCYHVSLRKLFKFAAREKLSRPSQMSACLGAGTGCGWCIPILKKIFDLAHDGDAVLAELGDVQPEAYAAERERYRNEAPSRNRFQPD